MSDTLVAPSAATLEVVQAPVYNIPRHWLGPLKNPVTGERANTRRRFSGLEDLAATIRKNGILQALVVRLPSDAGDPTTWTEDDHPELEIAAGERRWRASEVAGLDAVPCSLREISFEDAFDILLLENDQREDLNAVEQARGYREWLDLVPGRTQDQLATRIGRSQEYVSHRVRLLQLPESILEMIEEGELLQSYARDHLLPLLSLPEDAAEAAMERITEELHDELVQTGKISGANLQRRAAEIRQEVEREFAPPELFGGTAAPVKEAECRFCLCTDSAPCVPACGWLEVDREAGVGVCSSPSCRERWEAEKAQVAGTGTEEPDAEREARWDLSQEELNELCQRGRALYVERTGATALSTPVSAFGDGVVAFVRGTPIDGPPGYLLPRYHRDFEAGFEWAAEQHLTSLDAVKKTGAAEEPAPAASTEPPTAAKAAPTPSRASAPPPREKKEPERPRAQAPAAAPASTPAPVTTVLTSPTAGRSEIPEGAGFLRVVLAVLGGRAFTASGTPLPDGRVVFQLAPRMLKTGERPFSATAEPAELEAQLSAALDAHFTT